MDPNETLKQLRSLIYKRDADEDDFWKVSELFDGLDQWLSRGGFLPDAWKPQPPVCDNSLIKAFDN